MAVYDAGPPWSESVYHMAPPKWEMTDLIALNILVAKAMQKVGLYLYIAPFQVQMRLIIWLGMTSEGRKFLDYIPPELLKNKWDSRMEIELVNGSILKLIGADNFDSKMGAGARGGVFTEFSLQDPRAWNYIRPMFVENGGWALFNYTARGLNHGYSMHKMARDNPRWFHQYLTRDDTGFPDLELIQNEREDGMKESLILQEYYNDWNASTEETFLPLAIVSPTFKPEATLDPKDYRDEPVIFGCDVAYASQGDKATICCRQGRKIHFLRWYQGRDNQSFADEIRRFQKLMHPVAINVDAGRGEGVISRLERLGIGHLVNPIHFGGKVYEEGLANMKALMWSRMLDWFLSPGQMPDLTGLDESKYANEPVAEELLAQLALPYMLRDEKNRIAVEPKSSLRTRGESSPDLAESVGLAHAVDVDPGTPAPARLRDQGVTDDMYTLLQMQQQQEQYNPLDYMDRLIAGQGAPQ